MVDWGEIRKLQAELNRVQSSTGTFKLSESNCIEIVKRLTDMKLINVLFTLDGKEYIVPEHLEREIMYEIEGHGGRINIVDLQQILNVDLSHVQRSVQSLMKSNDNIILIQGEIITDSYITSLCTEINELLTAGGHISLADISTTFSLPLSFITSCIERSLGKAIKGQLDKTGSGLLYTEAYVSRHRSRLRGLFTAVTRPTPIAPLISQGNYHDKLFLSVLHELISSGEIAGMLHGRTDKAIYIPHVFSQMQNKWIDSFLNDNGYLEYDALSRLGISDPKGYIQQRYKDKDEMIILVTCCLGPSVIGEVTSVIEDSVIMSMKWIDVMTLLPSPCTEEDGETLLQVLYSKEDELIVKGTVLAHHEFIKSCIELFKPLLQEKAEKAAASSGSFLRQVSVGDEGGASAKGGGGRKGRQKKGKGRSERDESDTTSLPEMTFITTTEIQSVLTREMEDLPEEFIESLTSYLFKPLQERFQEEARQLLAMRKEGVVGAQRKRHAHLQGTLQELWNRVGLFVKGIELFENDLKFQLTKYLLKSLCTDMVNHLVRYVADDHSIKIPEDTATLNKDRLKIISQFSDPVKKLLAAVNNSLNGKEVVEFMTSFEAVCETDACGIMLKKLDKKREKQLIFAHQQELRQSLQDEQDPAMSLHLVTVLLFQMNTNCLLHMPGRLIPQVISYLRPHLKPEDAAKLSNFQSLVVMQIKSETSTNEPLEPKDKDDEDIPSDYVVIDNELFENEATIIGETVVDNVSDNSTNVGGATDTTTSDVATPAMSTEEQLKLMIPELKDLVLKQKK